MTTIMYDCHFSNCSCIVEVNEKDLTDRGININPSELDILLPVVNPTKSPILKLNTQSKTLETRQPFPSGEIENEILQMENAVNKISDSTETSSLARTDNTNITRAKINSSQKKTSAKEGYKLKMFEMVLKSGSNSLTKMNSPTKNSTVIGYVTNSKTNELQPHPKQVNYYNIYDVDKPVKIRRIQKHEPILTQEKQQILNDTLAVYGMHLDSQGENVILHDTRDNSGFNSSKIQTHKQGAKKPKTIYTKMGNKEKGTMAKTYFKRKNVDTIKSLWNILKNVSEKWQ